MTLDPQRKTELEALALRVREHIIRMSAGGGCFIGASLSCADLVVYLYREQLRLAPDRLKDPDRDYFLLSKGHDVPALYGTLAELGYIDRERLSAHLSPKDRRSEEHTSELQSRLHLVCRLLLEKKKPSMRRNVCQDCS